MADLTISLAVAGEEIVTGALRRVGEVAINALGAAFKIVADFAVESFKGAIEAQAGIDKLTGSIVRLGDKSPISIEQAMELSQQFKNLVGGSDDVVLAMQDVILRFDKISSDTFPRVIEQSADLAVALKTDPTSAAQLLGKVLQDLGTDGVGSIGRLKAAGVALTEEQEKQIKSLVEAGKVTEAQNVLLDALAATTGGKALTASQSLSGQFDIFKETLADAGEGVAMKLLPPLTELAEKVLPVIMPIIQGVADALGDFVEGILTGEDPLGDFSNLIYNLALAFGLGKDKASELFFKFQELADDVLPKLSQAVEFMSGIWTGTLLPALQGAWVWIQAELIPLWNEVFGILLEGAQTALPQLTDFWNNVLMPALQNFWAWTQANILPLLEKLWEWIKINLPIAIQTLVDFYTGVWLPAQIAITTWIIDNVFPMLGTLFEWLQTNIPIAIQTLSDFWNNTLLPAITAVWAFIQDPLLPLFKAVETFISTVFNLTLTALAGLWDKVLQPALEKVWGYLNENVFPLFKEIGKWLKETFGPIVQGLVDGALTALSNIWDGIIRGIKDATAWLQTMADKISSIKLPDWLTPGSPTPFEMGLRGISDALNQVTSGMNVLGQTTIGLGGMRGTASAGSSSVFNSGGNSNTHNYYGVQADMQAAYTRSLAGAF